VFSLKIRCPRETHKTRTLPVPLRPLSRQHNAAWCTYRRRVAAQRRSRNTRNAPGTGRDKTALSANQIIIERRGGVHLRLDTYSNRSGLASPDFDRSTRYSAIAFPLIKDGTADHFPRTDHPIIDGGSAKRHTPGNTCLCQPAFGCLMPPPPG